MIAFEWQGTGLWAWLDANRGGLSDKRIKTLARKAARQAFEEWAARKEAPGLQQRFNSSSAGGLGIPLRSARYMARVLKKFGRWVPFRSPNNKPLHMQNLLRPGGGGYRISLRNSTVEVEAVLRLPGAKVLNLLPAKFRQQFLDLHRQQADAEWLVRRCQEILIAMLVEAIGKTGRRKMLDKVLGKAA